MSLFLTVQEKERAKHVVILKTKSMFSVRCKRVLLNNKRGYDNFKAAQSQLLANKGICDIYFSILCREK